MYVIKDIKDLNRCIDLNDGIPLECYGKTVKNKIIVEKHQDGIYTIRYSINNLTKQYHSTELLQTKIGQHIDNRELYTHEFTINGTEL